MRIHKIKYILASLTDCFTLYEQILAEYKRLELCLKELEDQLVGLPPGTLVHKACGKYINWYHQLHHELTYLTKDQLALKEQFAYKKYITTSISDSQQ